jgi:hypothetical protein
MANIEKAKSESLPFNDRKWRLWPFRLLRLFEELCQVAHPI